MKCQWRKGTAVGDKRKREEAEQAGGKKKKAKVEASNISKAESIAEYAARKAAAQRAQRSAIEQYLVQYRVEERPMGIDVNCESASKIGAVVVEVSSKRARKSGIRVGMRVYKVNKKHVQNKPIKFISKCFKEAKTPFTVIFMDQTKDPDAGWKRSVRLDNLTGKWKALVEHKVGDRRIVVGLYNHRDQAKKAVESYVIPEGILAAERLRGEKKKGAKPRKRKENLEGKSTVCPGVLTHPKCPMRTCEKWPCIIGIKSYECMVIHDVPFHSEEFCWDIEKEGICTKEGCGWWPCNTGVRTKTELHAIGQYEVPNMLVVKNGTELSPVFGAALYDMFTHFSSGKSFMDVKAVESWLSTCAPGKDADVIKARAQSLIKDEKKGFGGSEHIFQEKWIDFYTNAAKRSQGAVLKDMSAFGFDMSYFREQYLCTKCGVIDPEGWTDQTSFGFVCTQCWAKVAKEHLPTDAEGRLDLAKMASIDPYLEELISVLFDARGPADVFWIRSRFEVPRPEISHLREILYSDHTKGFIKMENRPNWPYPLWGVVSKEEYQTNEVALVPKWVDTKDYSGMRLQDLEEEEERERGNSRWTRLRDNFLLDTVDRIGTNWKRVRRTLKNNQDDPFTAPEAELKSRWLRLIGQTKRTPKSRSRDKKSSSVPKNAQPPPPTTEKKNNGKEQAHPPKPPTEPGKGKTDNASKDAKPKNGSATKTGDKLPPGWKEFTDYTTKKTYYHHKASGKTVWELPTE